jgi:O-antigen ligase
MLYRPSVALLNFTTTCAALLVVAMPLSPFLLSLSMLGLIVAAFWHAIESCQAAGTLHIQKVLALLWKRFRAQPLMLALSLLLLAPALSYFWSINTDIAWDRIRVRLPFFVLPFAFANLPALDERRQQKVLYILVWALVLICIKVGIHFIADYQHIVDDLNHGRPVPVPRNHIRFNLMLALGILSGGWLWTKGFYWRWREERWFLAGAVLFMFFFIHVLTVRSGIIALYAALFYTILHFIVYSRKRIMGLILLSALCIVPVLAVLTIPSLQQRLNYMRYDWEQFRKNEGTNYSDSERWVSLSIGWNTWRKNPVFGVGAGDLPMEVQKAANEDYPNYSIEPRLPHNQFLYILATTGLFGLFLSLPGLFLSLFYKKYRQFYLFAVFQILIFISFLVEYTLETAIGVAFYLFYLLWFMKMAEGQAVVEKELEKA